MLLRNFLNDIDMVTSASIRTGIIIIIIVVVVVVVVVVVFIKTCFLLQRNSRNTCV